MDRINRLLLAFLALAACAACPAMADPGIVDVSLRLEPERPYVGERFTVCLDIATDPGCEIEGLSLGGFPYEVGVRQQGSREQARTADGRGIEWHRLRGTASATKAFSARLNCTVRAMLTRRVTKGFFNSVVSSTVGARIPPFDLEIREVPQEGAPEGYAGAIGAEFQVEAGVEPSSAAVGDLLTVTVKVSGAGTLNGASPAMPSTPGGDLRVYPPQELERTDSGVTLRQVVIPLSTNVTSLGMASLPYFDTAAGAYHVAESDPLAVSIAEKAAAAEAPAVKTIPAPVIGPRADTPGEKAISNVVATASDMRRVAPWAIAVLLAVIAGGGIGFRRTWLRLALAAAVFAAALAVGLRFAARGETDEAVALGEAVELRVAPSKSAKSLGWIPQGSEVRVVETYGSWTKVSDADGMRFGWTDGLVPPPGPDAGAE